MNALIFEVINKKFVSVKNKGEALAFKGAMPKTGKLQINANGDTAIAICNNKYCACKSVSEIKATVQKQGCENDEETGEIGLKKDATGFASCFATSLVTGDLYLPHNQKKIIILKLQ